MFSLLSPTVLLDIDGLTGYIAYARGFFRQLPNMLKSLNRFLVWILDWLGYLFRKIFYPIGYVFGLTFGIAKPITRQLKKLVSQSYQSLHVVLPFLSQVDLLTWSKKVIDATDNIYSRAMDAEYLKTHIGGADHRLFDGGHDFFSAWQKVSGASDKDSLPAEVVAFISELWNDGTTPKGLPLFTVENKENFDKANEWLNQKTGVDKSWLKDLISYDAFEMLSTLLGVGGAFFFLKRKDMKKVSEILGSMGVITLLNTNPFMGFALVCITLYAYSIKKYNLDNKKIAKGVTYTSISVAIFSILGLPVLVELFIVINVFRLIKKEQVIGYSFIKSIFQRIRSKPQSLKPLLLPE